MAGPAITAGGDGRAEIRSALAERRRLFSAFVNLLMLAGPLFMPRVCDLVLTSCAGATLVNLVVNLQ